MITKALGKIYQTGEIVIRQGETGSDMYVILDGSVEVVLNKDHKVLELGILGEGDFFGEMELFEPKPREATIRALRRSRILTVDKKTLLRRIQEDPALALRLLQEMAARIRHNHQAMLGLENGVE
jgi:CRP-like cAMP-binding protein